MESPPGNPDTRSGLENNNPMFNQLALKQKLAGGFGVAMLSIVALAVFSVIEIRGLTSVVSRAAQIHEMTRMGALASDLIGLERGIVLYSIFEDKAQLRRYQSSLDDTSKAFASSLAGQIDALTADGTRRRLQTLRARYESWSSMHKEIAGYLEHQQVDVAQAKLASPSFLATVDEMRKLADEMSEGEAKLLTSEAHSAEIVSMVGFGVLSILSLGVGAFVLVYILKVSNSLSTLTDSLAGNSQQVEGLSAGAHSASQSLAQGSTEQAASLQETSASTEEITAVTRQNVENSQSAAAVMTQVDEHIKDGNRTLELMVVSMNEINASSGKISKIIKVIDEIAFQTNILALNAAVEAARAGEAGLGFAVVADEVRNLAQRSAQAAKDTAAMIEESIGTSNDGRAKLGELSAMIRTITESAAKVKTLVDSVSVGSREQARGIEQIAGAVTQMEQMTQNTAQSANESASASDNLAGQARALNDVVLQLRALVDGGDGRGSVQQTDRRRVTLHQN
jgi:methyl-accepting chemotaxis protein